MQQPRLISRQDAPAYLGINKNHFMREIEPSLTKIIINNRQVFFERAILDKIKRQKR